jgi:YHS domain-containing protein
MNVRPLNNLLLALVSVIALGGCGAIVAQNPSGKYSPVNAVAEGKDSRVLLKGADVVAYFADNKYSAGLPQFSSQYEDVTFRFASAEHKALFDKAPTKYLPEFGGYCANGIAYGIPWGGDADTWKMVGGKLYIFGGQASKDAFELDEKKNLALAESYWRDEVAGSNSFVQRVKRMILRVPHYQSGEDLSRAVAAAKGGAGGGRK